MTLVERITDSINLILDETFETQNYDYIPTHNNQHLNELNTGKSFEAAVLYIDMRGSTKILKRFNRTTVAKIHKVYFEAIIPIVMRLHGRIRSYNGDSLIAFFKGTPKHATSDAVKAAMQINYIFCDEKIGINKYLKKYTEIDFGIGIDYGNILCTKIGSKNYDYSTDLIWIGHPVNRSVKLGDKANQPYSIYVSEQAYTFISSRMKFIPKKDFWGKFKEDLWYETSFDYGGETEICYRTKHMYPIY